jgi:membrane-associated phospholipid phosphatase
MGISSITMDGPQPAARFRWLPLALVGGFGLLASGLITALLILLHHDLVKPTLGGLDAWLPAWLQAHSSPFLDHIMWTLTTIGGPPVVILILCVALAVLLLRRRWGEAIGLVVSEIGGVTLNQIAKVAFHRQRPSLAWAVAHEKNYSFPSGHAMLGMITFGTIAFMLCRYYPSRRAHTLIITITSLLVFGIGVSRIYLHAHFPSDILAGWIAGGVWLVAVIAGTRLLHDVEPRVRPPKDQPQGTETLDG